MPEEGILVGYTWLVDHLEGLDIYLPLPEKFSMIGKKTKYYEDKGWSVYNREIKATTEKDHLFFALKHEGLDLMIIKNLLKYLGPEWIVALQKESKTSIYVRKCWFLYEWFFEEELPIEKLTMGNYIDLVDTNLQYAAKGVNSRRQRVRNNLPGNPLFCPLINKSTRLEDFVKKNLDKEIKEGLAANELRLIKRAAAFLLLEDSQASFEIEKEKPSPSRARNWGKVIGLAGKEDLSISEIERLQQIVFGKNKLKKEMGVRKNQEGFIGNYSKEYIPDPVHISAKYIDLPDLMKAWLNCAQKLEENIHPVLAATVIAFGFVFIHPLADGNGRIHRYLIHHMLARTQFAPSDMIFPISAAILDRIREYQAILESYSSPRLEMVEWDFSSNYDFKITNDTRDVYGFYNLTKQAEFLFQCIEDTIREIIPREIEYLKNYDQMFDEVNDLVALPNARLNLLIRMLSQNKGKLSKGKRKHFDELSDEEIASIEKIYTAVF